MMQLAAAGHSAARPTAAAPHTVRYAASHVLPVCTDTAITCSIAMQRRQLYTARLSCYLRPLLKSEKGSAGVSKSPTSLKSNQQQQKSSASCGGLVVFPRQRPPSRTPQLRRGARAAAGCERSSAGPRGGRSTLPAHPRPVVSGAIAGHATWALHARIKYVVIQY